MDFIRFSIKNPVTVIVGVILVVLFGCVSLLQIPIQLSPNVEEPVITVTTIWPGATPYEIERDIVEEQEKRLKGVPGLYEIESTSSNGMGAVTLRFKIGTDIDSALLRVSNKLDEIPSYPENVDRPIVNASGAESSPVVWVVMQPLEGNDRDAYTYRTFFENDVRQYFDRIDGVADLFVGGGVEQEMHVVLDPQKLASFSLTITDVVNAIRAGNANVSAGVMDVGKNEYRIRSVAEYGSTEEIDEVVVVSDGERIVRVRDIAEVRFDYQRLDTPMLRDGSRGISMGIRPEPNTNILDLTDAVEQVVNELNAGLLKDNHVGMTIVNEQRPYIRGAIDLLKQNIAVGGALAIAVLLVFLRSVLPTVVVATAIPISIVGTFPIMYAMGSTLNVVSLAGIAFAVGMLVDNAIVVLENIDRHRAMGKSAYKASYEGAREVWGAVLASSLTTAAVFLPVIFLEDEAGQLFKDIAIAVCSSVTLSLVVSLTVIPMVSRQLYGHADAIAARRANGNGNGNGVKRKGPLALLGAAASAAFIGVLNAVLWSPLTRIVTILVMTGAAAGGIYFLTPKMEYLPQGNRDLVINIIVTPPGQSFDERTAIGRQLYAYLEPYIGNETGGYPAIKRMFFVGRGSSLVLGVVSNDQARTRELVPLCQEAIRTVKGSFGISNQASIFQTGLGQGRTISVDFSGGDINQLVAAARTLLVEINGAIAGVQVRPVPSLDMLYRESNFVPDRERLQAVDMTAQEFGVALDVLMDGRDVGDYKEEGRKKIDLIVKAGDVTIPEDLYDTLIVTRGGRSVPISSLSKLDDSVGLTEIRHLERNRTISLQVTPPYEVTIQEAMETINERLLPKLEAQGLLEGVTFGMSGTADKLTETRRALQWNFVLAAAICYLLMAALLSNFVYPFIIMFTVPLAAAGGLAGLKLMNVFIAAQQLDILTMLGFIILIGVVVNNAILIVYQALQNVRIDGMAHKEAVVDSVRTRLRPIYMSATTSLFGMLPLVLWPGPGSELYRGLGAVVLGGLAVSTFFTVYLIPAILMFFIVFEKPGSAKDDE